jgi:hypothetical protein
MQKASDDSRIRGFLFLSSAFRSRAHPGERNVKRYGSDAMLASLPVSRRAATVNRLLSVLAKATDGV